MRGDAIAALFFALCLVLSAGCASRPVRDLDAYDDVAMSRVVPYPEAEEMRKRAYEIVVVDREAIGIDEVILEKPRAKVRRALEGIASESGAAVIDRSLQSVRGIRDEGVLSELEGNDAEHLSGADYALATRFSTYRYVGNWKPPFKFLWQSREDVASKPGTCTHRVEIEIDVQVVEIGRNGRVSRTYALEHGVEESNPDLDEACTLAPVTLDVMFEKALDEALSCLEMPLGTLLSPRGHITAHRQKRDGEGDIFRISIGAVHGVAPGDPIEIRREQRSMSPLGEEARLERVIAKGVVTDQVQGQRSWVAVDLSKAAEEILDGDVARPVLSEGLLSSLSGPKCGEILRER
ncbi:MAG: hypothetical protein AB8G23_17885 [Myxococcota bacterium]